MANTLRIKRRAAGGAAGAPSTLENAELAFNEQDDTLYYGKGSGGAGGSATTVEAIGGSGAYVTKGTTQTISGNKTFSGDILVPTQITSDSSTKAASTAFVKSLGFVSAPTGVATGTFTKVTINTNGYVTLGATLSSSDIPTLTASKISDFDTQVRTSRLDQMAAPTGSLSLNSQKITGLANPTLDTDAANKIYVDNAIQGIDPKNSVRVATTANITLSAPQTIDGISVIAGDRVLVKDQTTPAQNGIYLVAAGAWTRSLDADTWGELTSAYTFVEDGTTNADSGWVCTVNSGGTIGTTAVSWTQFSGAGQITAGTGLTKTGNTLNVIAGTGISVAADSVAVTTPLAVIAGLTPAADSLPYYTGASSAALTTLTSFGRSLIDDADNTAARTTLGLGSMATQVSSAVSITGGSIDGIVIDGGTF